MSSREQKVYTLSQWRGGKVWLAIAAVVLVAYIVLRASVQVVDAGQACAIVTLGQIQGVADPGIHVRIPMVTNYVCYSTRVKVYETSEEPGTSQADFTDIPITGQTKDGQQISMTFSVRFYVPAANVGVVYSKVAESEPLMVERVVKFHARNVARLTMQEFDAQHIYSGDIAQIEKVISDRLTPLFLEKGVVMDMFAIRKPSFDPEYVRAIENQQIAMQNILTQQYNAQAAVKEADKNAALAEGEARATAARAEGEAKAKITLAEAEAKALELKGQVLARYPQMLQLQMIDILPTAKWLTLPQNSIPMLDLSK
jgi:prohibitin 2